MRVPCRRANKVGRRRRSLRRFRDSVFGEQRRWIAALAAFAIPFLAADADEPPLGASGQGAFASRYDFTELRGLPPRPASSLLSFGDLNQILAPVYVDLRLLLLSRHGLNGRIRLLESYSRTAPTYLKQRVVYIPNADGVIQPSPGTVPPGSLGAANCNALSGTHTCADIYKPALKQQEYDVVFLVGWDVELAGDVATNGQTLVIVANRFRANGFTINTSPTKLTSAEPPQEQPGPKAANGRAAPPSGHVIIYAAELTGIHATTDGMAGEAGLPGKDAVGQITATKITDNHTLNPSIQCSADVVQNAQAGGDGGAGGAPGSVFARYSVLRGLGPRRQPSTTKPVTDRECIGQCSNSFACSQNPMIAICGAARESDNAACTDGQDNDLDGYVDCTDTNCSKNPYVTACHLKTAILESSPEACTDHIDNDQKDKLDCADPQCAYRQICGAPPGQPFVVRTGIEEASTASCSDGIDNDLDGKVDCDDPECPFNPLVTVCGKERTLEACTDKLDNDGDGKTDCNDSGCKNNPYVLLCASKPSPFLKESSAKTCADGIDNDQDGFIDCKDYQCLNNPLASAACGIFENTLAACRDKIDNDGDGRVDCDDANCSFNPFFGELICHGRIKTKHSMPKSAQAFYNGVYKESEASYAVLGAPGGKAGQSGKPLVGIAAAHYYDAGCFPCLDEECLYCVDETMQLECTKGGAPGAGPKAGVNSSSGTFTVRWLRRVEVDALRALLSPRQWVVGMAQGNALFKRGTQTDLEEAGFLYIQDVLRMVEVLHEWGLKCSAPATEPTGPTNLEPVAETLLLTTICPAAIGDLVHLIHLVNGRNFYGFTQNRPINPHARYDIQYQAFTELFGLLGSAVTNWIQLANGLDISFQIGESQQQFEELAATLSVEVDLAVKRENAALQELSTLEDKMNQRKLALQKITAEIGTNNGAIKDKYDQDSGGLGQFILDLAGAFAEAYVGSVLEEIGKSDWEAVKGIFEQAGSPSGKAAAEGVLGPNKSNNETQGAEALDDIWEFVERHGETALESKPVEDAVKEGTSGLEDFALGKGISNPVRSVVVDEIANEILESDQRQLVLDHLDLTIDKRKAETDYAIAKMERALMEMRLKLAGTTASRIENYMLSSAELRAYDKVLLGQQIYGNALTLVEDLTRRYWHLLRQAEYEKLPYEQKGASELDALVSGNFDFNLKNYLDMGQAAVKVNQFLQQKPRGAATRFYRRLPGSVLKLATESDKARFAATGLLAVPPFDSGMNAHVASFLITNSDIDADLILRSKRNIRIDDVRVSLLGSNGTITAPVVFLLRDELDVFRVRRQQFDNLYKEYDLIAQDQTASLSSVSPVHYQSFSACLNTPPACSLTDPTCTTPFQNQSLDDYSCGVQAKTPGPQPWKENVFFDRSLVGRWMVVIADDVFSQLGSVQEMEITFVVAALDL